MIQRLRKRRGDGNRERADQQRQVQSDINIRRRTTSETPGYDDKERVEEKEAAYEAQNRQRSHEAAPTITGLETRSRVEVVQHGNRGGKTAALLHNTSVPANQHQGRYDLEPKSREVDGANRRHFEASGACQLYI